ncbi:acetyl-CoA carboxylase biotin carboxylase subunit [Thermomicrobiaceae bacterium CFH 74404]|uniref:Biotin carboxylase n=1 Tax=Thermalbibacter longus TaxID=2951981 RepID=A0AA41WC39_9BACT|nr:acetyl-CoA carboxylase biotin carboxylase subunit [Thermalbibacter longus]MCM8750281.1 acetyl-CoA carboxylase biotin carboxylase subunit [Thermalbibacter longus]
MFRKVLVANRGEIAVRVMRACRELGIATVAVYSEADATALHVRYADEARCIGPAVATRSYLNIEALVQAARETGAEAVHPGYGFLAENAAFARACREAGLVFIGPSPEAIELMGDKAAARTLAREAGVPVVPGTPDKVSTEEALAAAEEIGFPLMVKAAAGGGGRGIRVVECREELAGAVAIAAQEAQAAFGDGALYLERYLSRPRHIEVQVLGDEHGNVLHLFERECSIQRRRQKLLEEAPSPALTPELREQICAAAVRLARAAGYTSAGTLEFLLDQEGQFYFLEMNTRIQVEHPVTELVTGVDLVKEQIRVAAGEPLRWQQEELELRGHAIEFRINAEDPEMGFFPSPGVVEALELPGGPGVRVDHALYAGYEIPPYYDSLIAKLIVWGVDREEALARGRRALAELRIEGIATTAPFHRRLLGDPAVIAADYHVQFLDGRV